MISLRNGASPGSKKAWSDPGTASLRKDTKLFNEALSMGRMAPNEPELVPVEAELGQALKMVLAGQKSADEALKSVNDTAIKVLKQSGKLK